MKNSLIDPLHTVYASLADAQLLRHHLMPTIEACTVALVGERAHSGGTSMDLNNLVRLVRDDIGLRPSPQHWLATGSHTGDEEVDPRELHASSRLEFVEEHILWVTEDDLLGDYCPPQCALAIRPMTLDAEFLAIVPRL